MAPLVSGVGGAPPARPRRPPTQSQSFPSTLPTAAVRVLAFWTPCRRRRPGEDTSGTQLGELSFSGRPHPSSQRVYIVPVLAASQPINSPYGTRVGLRAIVLGNRRIHLDISSKITNIDPSLTVQGYPGLLERERLRLELQTSQPVATAGLVQCRTEGTITRAALDQQGAFRR